MTPQAVYHHPSQPPERPHSNAAPDVRRERTTADFRPAHRKISCGNRLALAGLSRARLPASSKPDRPTGSLATVLAPGHASNQRENFAVVWPFAHGGHFTEAGRPRQLCAIRTALSRRFDTTRWIRQNLGSQRV